MRIRKTIGAGAASALLACMAPQAQARAAGDVADVAVDAPAASAAANLPEVTVTSRKRSESLQKVPMSVSVIEAGQAEDERVFDAEQLLRQVPNMGYNSIGDARSTFMSIRGIGPLAQPVGNDDTSTVVYVDGVPQPLFGSDLSFLDVERVEVMRGPQGTLFGRNAQAGAINIVTPEPGDAFEGEATVEAGSDRWRRAKAVVSGPIQPGVLAGRLAFGYSALDGDVDNLAGGAVGDARNRSVRGTLVATPSPDTKAKLSLSAQADNNVPSNFVLRQGGDPVVLLEPAGHAQRRLGAAALTVEHSFDAVRLTSVSAYNRFRYRSLSNNSEALTFGRLFGLDASNFVPGTDLSTYDESQRTLFQELRLSSLPGAAVAWTAGVNYFDDSYRMNSWYTSPFFASTNGWRENHNRTRSAAVFGEATVPLAQRLELTAGLRYTHDRKRYDSDYLNNGFAGNVPAFSQDGELRYGLWSGRLSLSWLASDQTTLYATVGRGAKSGGFPNFTSNAVSGQRDEPYAASSSWSYEAGAKQRYLGGRLSLNTAVFFNDVAKQSVVALNSASYVYEAKAIDTRSYGAEAEMAARLAPGLDLAASLGYTHAALRNVEAGVAAFSGAADGNRVPGVPRYTAALSLQYNRSAAFLGLPGNARLTASAQYQYVGKRAADIGGHFDLDGYGIVNARLGLSFNAWEVYLFGRNLGNAHPQYLGIWYGPGIDTTTVGHGRVMGLGATVRF